MIKKDSAPKILVSLFVYTLSLSLVDFFCNLSTYNVYFDFFPSVCMLIFSVFSVGVKSEKPRKRILYAGVIVFIFVCVPLMFLAAKGFDGSKMLLFITSAYLLFVLFRRKTRINLLCLLIIIYISCIIIAVYMSDYLCNYIHLIKNITSHIWHFILTALCFGWLAYVFLELGKIYIPIKEEPVNLETIDKNIQVSSVMLCFSIKNSRALNEKLGAPEYNIALKEIREFFYSFTDENTIVCEYSGDRMLLIMKKRSIAFAKDFAQGILLSLDEDVEMNYSMMKYNPGDDFFEILKETDKKL